MQILTTNKGRTIECDLVVRGRQYAVLHIYTHTITPVEAYQIFGNPDEAKKLIVTEEGQETKTYTGFTEIYSVQKGGLITGPDEILIWLQRPDPDE